MIQLAISKLLRACCFSNFLSLLRELLLPSWLVGDKYFMGKWDDGWTLAAFCSEVTDSRFFPSLLIWYIRLVQSLHLWGGVLAEAELHVDFSHMMQSLWSNCWNSWSQLHRLLVWKVIMVLILCGIPWHIKYPESGHMEMISLLKWFWSSGNTPVTMATNNTSNLKVTVVLDSLRNIILGLWIGEFMLGSISALPSKMAHFFPLTILTFTFNNEKDSDSLFIALSNPTVVSKSHKI